MDNKINFLKQDQLLIKELKKMQPYDIALQYPDFTNEEKIRIRKLVDYRKIILIFENLEEKEKMFLFEELPTLDRKMKLLDNLKIDELKEFISFYDEEKQEDIINLLKPQKQIEIKKMLIYKNNLAASLMTTEIIKVNENISVKDATSYLIYNCKDNDYIDDIYVVDNNNVLKGIVKLKDLIIARTTDNFKDLMDIDYNYIYHDKAVFEALDIVKNYDEKAIVVLDYDKKVLGVVTTDDILEETLEEKKQAFQSLAYLSNHSSSFSGVKRCIRRIPWLLIAIILGIFIAFALGIFEKTTDKIVVLFLFQSLILDAAGNIGTQSLAVTILKLTNKELGDKSKIKKHFKREINVALINSFLIGIYGFIISFSFLSIFNGLNLFNETIGKINNLNQIIYVSIIVSLSLLISMFISAIIGVLIPILANKKKINPGNVSGPVLTTLNDLIALASYYAIATIFLNLF